MARSLFPDAISGISYTPEELGAEVNELGEVVDAAFTETGSHSNSSLEAANTTVSPTQENREDDKPPVIEMFSAVNPVHREKIEHFLSIRKAIAFYDKLMVAMSGKEFRGSVIKDEWAKINPEAPDVPKED
jgi:hypothetical protein